MATSMQDNLTSQQDEVAALSSIYGNDFHIDPKSALACSIDVNESLKSTLEVTLPIDYPSLAPPIYTLHAPWLKGARRQELCNCLEDIYLENIGENIIYLWVERIRQFIIDEQLSMESCNKSKVQVEEVEVALSHSSLKDTIDVDVPCPDIISGDIITDRKSHFQPHIAGVQSIEEVRAVLKKLYENKKIANAFHNMYAYRFTPKNSTSICQDCEDDGEAHAGGRMLHLLQILDAKNVLVVVSRWYGGIQLGPDRFKHINNATRQVLDMCGYIKSKVEDKKKKKGK